MGGGVWLDIGLDLILFECPYMYISVSQIQKVW